MKLDEYLASHGIRKKFFAAKCDITEPTLQSIIAGYDCLLSNAIRIEEETKGAVKIKELRPTKVRTSRAKADLGYKIPPHSM